MSLRTTWTRAILTAALGMSLAGAGCTGDEGPPGPAGQDGANGADGANGTDGTDGSDGTDGRDGSDVSIVANEACLVCHDSGDVGDVEAVHVAALDVIDPTDDLVIEDANVAVDGGTGAVTISIDFTFDVGYRDIAGNKIAVNPATPRASNATQLEYIRFFVARLVPGENGSPDTWLGYAAGDRDVAGLVHNGGTSYTYTFAGDFQADYDATATHRVGIQLYHLDGIKVVNPLYDFVPDGVTALRSHEVVNIDSCNECHGTFAIHGGGRVETGMCVMCHNETRAFGGGTGLETGLDFPMMIHKIHTAQMVDDHDFTEVTYPQDPRNCAKCHNGADAATPQGDNWKLVPNRKACGSCHTAVDFLAHPTASSSQTDDSACALCHNAAFITTKHMTDDPTPNNPGVAAGVPVIEYQLHEARVTGTTLEVDFTIWRDDTANAGARVALDITALPTDLTDGGRYPSFLTPYALPQGGIDAPADFNNRGNSGGVASSWDLGALIADGKVSDGATADDGIYTATIENAYPDGATLRAVALQSYFRITPTTVEYSLHTPSVIIGVTGDDARRVIVDNDKCAACHESLALHGGSRVYEVLVCAACHTPNLTSSGRVADPAGLPTETIDALGNDPLVFPEDTQQLKNLVHGIHGAGLRDRDFEFVRNRNGGLYYNWSEVTYPGILQNCETCHRPGTYGAELPANVLPSTVVTTDGVGDDRDALIAARDSVPNATDLASSPLAATCYGCHASQPVEAHIEQNGGIIAQPRSAAGLAD